MRRIVVAAAVLAAVFGGALGAGAAGNGTPVDRSANALTVAVIGDTPYGAAQLETLPQLLGAIDADPKVDLVLHLGDIKNGSSLCTDAYLEAIKAQVDTLKDPFVFTPGDNEWTDCHRANNGSYLPTERLAKLRATFYPEAGVSGGGRKPVLLLEGDSHTYTVDTPLAGGSPAHGVTVSAPNVTRIVVEGQNTSEWLRLTVDPRAAEPFAWERVQA